MLEKLQDGHGYPGTTNSKW